MKTSSLSGENEREPSLSLSQTDREESSAVTWHGASIDYDRSPDVDVPPSVRAHPSRVPDRRSVLRHR